ncbi:MAG: hypothetical protein QM655_15915 [Nocardioidaceae bacterium]
MNIPVVLPVARVRVDDAGELHVTLDGEPHGQAEHPRRRDLQQVLADLTREVGTPVRVEVTEADGTTYCDIATPAEAPIGPDAATDSTTQPCSGVHGVGFQPGERVAVAYVLLQQTADAEGAAELHLPAALARRGGTILLFGLDSHVGTLIEAPA